MSDLSNQNFDWEQYDRNYKGGNKLTPNPNIKGQTLHTKCYSRESYAQELFNLYTDKENDKIYRKDLIEGDTLAITNIINVGETSIVIELEGGLTVDIDLLREKKFINLFGHNSSKDFTDALKENKDEFLKAEELLATIISVEPLKISLWQGHLKKIKEKFMKEIENSTSAYMAKIIEANKGGYFVEVQGLEAFMPGSLAAPNKLVDFRSLIGKEVIVMIEDYIHEMQSFIVSHKKYIQHILPKRINELDLDKQYSGTITGTSKYGIFIEFDDIFTGLLHVSKMEDSTLKKFKNREFKAGLEMNFYINEITKDKRIILSEESPEEKRKKVQEFIDKQKGKTFTSTIAAIMGFGIIVNFEDHSGLIPNKEFKKKKLQTKNFMVGDKIDVAFDDYKDDKLIFKLP